MSKKILILCPYSYPSACGIWSRVYSDAKALIEEGYEVHVFSSNVIKGTDKISPSFEILDSINIHRFPVKFSLGENGKYWEFRKEINLIDPEIIHTHGYRHPHSLLASLYAKKYKKTIFLTSHGPFEKDPKRSILIKLIENIYDLLISKFETGIYKNVIALSKWEEQYLVKLGFKRIVIIPNGIDRKFFENRTILDNNKKNRIIYLGRIDYVKRLEIFNTLAEKLPNIKFFIRGTKDSEIQFTSRPNLKVNYEKYSVNDFIEEAKQSDIFILPSVRESFGIVIIEAMSQGLLVISSNTAGAKSIITNGVNGFIFNSENEILQLIENYYLNKFDSIKIRESAIEYANKYNEKITTKSLINLYGKINS